MSFKDTNRIILPWRETRTGARSNASSPSVRKSNFRRQPHAIDAIITRLYWLVSTQIAGVRQHGSYKRYARSFHRDVLAVRGLAQRGKLSTDDSVLNFLARLGDNGVVWHVLEYWRATY